VGATGKGKREREREMNPFMGPLKAKGILF
jgi:hypothetical protein